MGEVGRRKVNRKGQPILDVSLQSPRARQFSEQLGARIVAQDRAVKVMSGLYQVFLAGMNPARRPIGTLLFLGPTGSGKTRVAEATAEVLFGDPRALVKIDCAEFQQPHEIAKLIGPPPGYVGHRDTPPLLSQENLDRCHTDEHKLSIVLFDEIEKASETLWQLLLGILDRATLTLGDNRTVDFTRAIVIMTSNLGAHEMADAVSGGLGFAPKTPTSDGTRLNQALYRAGVEAARRRFSPELMNRIDKTVVFQSLDRAQLAQILELELKAVQERLLSAGGTRFLFTCTPEVKEHLLDEGTDARYGARHLKRAIERRLVLPLSALAGSNQVSDGDLIEVELDDDDDELLFSKQATGAPLPLPMSAEAPPHGEKSPAAAVAYGDQDLEMATKVAVATAAALTGVIMTLIAESTPSQG